MSVGLDVSLSRFFLLVVWRGLSAQSMWVATTSFRELRGLCLIQPCGGLTSRTNHWGVIPAMDGCWEG
jgi:hypothetical protein